MEDRENYLIKQDPQKTNSTNTQTLIWPKSPINPYKQLIYSNIYLQENAHYRT